MHCLSFRCSAILAGLAVLAACATLAPSEPPVSDNAAVLALITQARTDTTEAKYTAAAAGIERALRIEPRNPRLWQELARVRLAQGDASRPKAWPGAPTPWPAVTGSCRLPAGG